MWAGARPGMDVERKYTSFYYWGMPMASPLCACIELGASWATDGHQASAGCHHPPSWPRAPPGAAVSNTNRAQMDDFKRIHRRKSCE